MAFCLIVPAIVYFALPIDGKTLTHEMAMFLAVTIFMVCIWGFELVNDTATGLVLPVLYMALCGVPGKIAYNNWLGDVPNIVIGGFIFVKFAGYRSWKTGWFRLHEAYGRFVHRNRLGTYACDLYYQSARSRGNGQGCHFCAIVISLCESLDFKKQSREATALMLVAFLAVTSSKTGF